MMLRQNSDNKYCDHQGVSRLLEELVSVMEQRGIQFPAQMELPGQRPGDLIDKLTSRHMRVSCYMLDDEFCLLMQFPH